MGTGRALHLYACLVALLLAGCAREYRQEYAGSASCRECHERFYELWSTSHHGLAMQAADSDFRKRTLTAQTNAIVIGDCRYRTDPEVHSIIEDSPLGQRSYPIVHALGGKYIYYLLTPLERGRLQVLPLAYDVQRREWFDAGGSMVRHFSDGSVDEALSWRDPQLTFNMACYGCHVSQIAKNYNITNDSYHTQWREPGISCESCHGPCSEHIRVCRATPTNHPPADLKLISHRQMTRDQSDDTCATCHAKARPITTDFNPLDHFFDHYDLTAFEHRDFHPDGRDLGENYTFTLWLTSPCVKSGQLGCVHCHTSSGRYRFAGENSNQACLPCHQQHVDNAPAHTHHPADSKGNHCVSCHMPMSNFARMNRSDHSMRPPTPAATIAFKSPNACNLCHTDKMPQWADQYVRTWRQRDFQAPVMERAKLIEAARQGDWSELKAMLAYIRNPSNDTIFAVSLVRLLDNCSQTEKWPVIREMLNHPHPLMRAAAVTAHAHDVSQATFPLLVKAAQDNLRLVRISAAHVLARYPSGLLELPSAKPICDAAFAELEASYLCMPDSWASHYNIGNYYDARGWSQRALDAFAQSTRLRPDMIEPVVNAAMIQARNNNLTEAVTLLKRAEKIAPQNVAVHLNLGMARAEQGNSAAAEQHFRAALASDTNSAQAAYNLGVLLNRKGPTPDGLEFCRRATEQAPLHPNYAYTYAYYLHAMGRREDARHFLQEALARGVSSDEIVLLLRTLR